MTTIAAGNGGRAQPSRLLPRLLVLILLTLAVGIGLAGSAAAHNVLIGSDPVDGSTLQTAPTSVTLTFDQPVQDFEPVVSVLDANGQQYETGPIRVDGTVVSTPVAPLPAAGGYVIAYRVVSADGHPVQGEIRFELAAAGTGQQMSLASGTGSPAATTPATAQPAAAGSSGPSEWIWAAIAVAAVLVVAAAAVMLRRRTRDSD